MPKGKKITKAAQARPTPTKIPTNTTVNRLLRREIGLLNIKINQLEQKLKSDATNTEVNNERNNLNHVIEDDRRVFYTVQNLNNEKPKYPGKTNIHPVTFIEDLTAYIKKSPTVSNITDLIIECLDGDVRNWARIYKERWTEFADFQKDFLDTYWGETEQNALRRQIVQNQWDPTKHPTMLGHFLSLVGQAKMLTYQIPDSQLIADIMRHFPKETQYVATLNKPVSILEATDLLRKIDNINGQDKPESTQPPPDSRQQQGNWRHNYRKDWKKSSNTTGNYQRQHVNNIEIPQIENGNAKDSSESNVGNSQNLN